MSLDDSCTEISSTPWRPSAKLSSRLLLGTTGVLGAAVSFAAATVLTLLWNFPAEPFQPCWWLGEASSLLLILPMAAYHLLGSEIDSPGLQKTSVCLALAATIGPVLELADPAVVPMGCPSVLLGIGSIGMLVVVLLGFFYPRSRKSPENASGASDAEGSGQVKGTVAGVGGGVLFLIFMGLRTLWRGLRWQGKQWAFEELMLSAGESCSSWC